MQLSESEAVITREGIFQRGCSGMRYRWVVK
jgi:hypothetical protein